MRLKNKILSGLAGILLNGCLTFHGGLDVAFVPQRVDDRLETPELKTALTIEAEIPIKKSKFYIEATNTTYSKLPTFKMGIEDFTFNPVRTSFDLWGGFKLRDNIDFYFHHLCSHPISEQVMIYKIKLPQYQDTWYWTTTKPPKDFDYTGYALDYDAIDEIGVRVRF